MWSITAKGGNDRTAGRLASAWKRLSACPNSSGHMHVNLFRDGRNHLVAVHRIVLEAFVGPCPEGMEGCHYPDADKRNNALANLRWDAQAENAKDRYRDRLASPVRTCRGCNLTKPVEEMARDKRKPDGLAIRCKRCEYKRCNDLKRARLARQRKENP